MAISMSAPRDVVFIFSLPFIFTLRPPVTTSVVCSSQLLMFLDSLALLQTMDPGQTAPCLLL